MSDTINNLHINLKQIRKSGNDKIIDIVYPKNTTDDVELSNIENSSIPTGIDNVTGIINNLGSGAFSNKTVVDSALSSTSTNPVQNKVINNALSGKSDNGHTHTKAEVGLGNVDNTADANKSVKSATSATNDSAGQKIDNTYIKDVSISGKNVTITKGDGTKSTQTTQDTTYSTATKSANGLMSSTDKKKLDGIAEGANKTIVDSDLDLLSTNPVQNQAITNWLSENVKKYRFAKDNNDNVYLTSDEVSTTAAGPADSDNGGYESVYGILVGTSEYKFGSFWNNIKEKPNSFTPSKHTHTKAEVGLGNVDNTADANKSVKSATTATQDSAGQKIDNTYIKDVSISGKTVTITKGDGTETTQTTQDTTYTTATQSANGLMSSTDKKKLDGIAEGANKTIIDSALSSTSTNPVQNKVVNTAISNLSNLVGTTAVSAQITNAITNQKGKASGIAELDSNGKVPSSQLPSYVDDVIEGYYSSSKFYTTKSSDGTYSGEITGETGKIYIDLNTNKTYRWSGSAYTVISETLAIGTTSSTAFRGDYGNTAYAHATAKGSAFTSGLYKITTNDQGHVTAATAVTKSDITKLGIPPQDTVYTHPTGPGYNHIPSGGSSGQILRWSENGTAMWGADNNTDTKVTSVGNHYTPSGGTTTSASGGDLTDITNSSSGVQVVTGVTKDAAGHVTGVTSVALKSTNTNTDTKVTAVGNHYTPSGGTTTSASGGTLTDITNSSSGVQVVTGVTKDAAGHVTGVTSAALKSVNTVYTHPSSHPATMITEDSTHRFVTDSEKSTWNAKASTAVATSSANGLMSKDDKTKLDGIATGANKYVHPSYTAKTDAKLYKTTIDGTGHVNSAAEVTKADITALGIPAQDTTYSVATKSANGLMSKDDKTKLDGIATGANKTVVDSALSSTSTNPVQNKVINTALSGKSDTGHKHTKSEITDFPTSMPASDVYSWAKASTKPSYTKAEVGLGNVDNTSDINKPISTAVQTALTKLDTSLKEYADTKISNLIGGAAPETLDTIVEIAEAISNNKSVIDALNDSVANKVDKVSGKGLSTNDFTNGYKSNVDANTTARHSHSNKTVLDAISSTKTGNWDSAYTHISDTTKHITANERTLWNTVSDKEPKIVTKNTAFNKNFGTAAGTVCQGNDSRLSDARKANGGNSDTVGGKNPNTFAYLATASSTVDSVSSVDANTVGGYAPADLIKTTDVVNSLTSNETSKPLSANQGKALKALIDAKTVPSNLSAFNDDVGYLTSAHNTSSTAHSDIRTSLTTISNKMNLFFDTNNTAFDQLSELIAYMQLNRDKANSALEGLNNCISSSKLSDGYTEGDSTKVASNKAVTDVYNAIPTTVASLSDAGNYAKKNVSQTFSGTQTFATAKASASTAYTTAKFRNIVLSTAEPTSSNGNNGDVWIVYSA